MCGQCNPRAGSTKSACLLIVSLHLEGLPWILSFGTTSQLLDAPSSQSVLEPWRHLVHSHSWKEVLKGTRFRWAPKVGSTDLSTEHWSRLVLLVTGIFAGAEGAQDHDPAIGHETHRPLTDIHLKVQFGSNPQYHNCISFHESVTRHEEQLFRSGIISHCAVKWMSVSGLWASTPLCILNGWKSQSKLTVF